MQHKYKTIRYQAFFAMFFIIAATTGTLLYFVQEIFYSEVNERALENVKFRHDSLANLISLNLQERIHLSKIFANRLQDTSNSETSKFHDGIPKSFSREILGLTIFRKNAESKLELVRLFRNGKLLANRKFGNEVLSNIYREHPLPFAEFIKLNETSERILVLNRSVKEPNKDRALSVLTLMLPGESLGDSYKDMIVAVDFLQDFLQKTLIGNAPTTSYIAFTSGKVLSHPKIDFTQKYSRTPITSDSFLLAGNNFQTREQQGKDEVQLARLLDRDFPDLILVSQTATLSWVDLLKLLLEKLTWIPAAIFGAASLLIFVCFAVILSKRRLLEAASEIAHVNLEDYSSSQEGEEIANEAPTDEAEETSSEVAAHEVQHPASQQHEPFQIIQPQNITESEIWLTRSDSKTLFLGYLNIDAKTPATLKKIKKQVDSMVGKSIPNEPGKFVKALNTWFYKKMRKKANIRGCFASIDLESGYFSTTSAGHTPISIHSPSTKGQLQTTFPVSANEELGVQADAEFPVYSDKLHPGSSLVLTSLMHDDLAAALRSTAESFPNDISAMDFNAQTINALNRYSDGEEAYGLMTVRWGKTREHVSTPPQPKPPAPEEVTVSKVVQFPETTEAQAEPEPLINSEYSNDELVARREEYLYQEDEQEPLEQKEVKRRAA